MATQLFKDGMLKIRGIEIPVTKMTVVTTDNSVQLPGTVVPVSWTAQVAKTPEFTIMMKFWEFYKPYRSLIWLN